LTPAARCRGCGSNDTILVFTLNFLSRPRAGSEWPEPNDLLALPTENQTLWYERVLRQETIVLVFGIGATELFVWRPSSSAQLPLQSCVDWAPGFANSWRDCGTPTQRVAVSKLRSPTKTPYRLGSVTTFRLKGRIDCRAGVETRSFYSCLNSEEFCFNGGRSRPRGRIYRIAEEEFQEKELIPGV
jgi:hypothetical protein